MHVLRWPLVLVSLTVVAAVARSADPTPTDADFTEQLRKLDAKNDKADRIAVLRWLNWNAAAKNAGLAIPALEKCIRDDPAMEVRRDAIGTLMVIARKLDKPCPLVLIEMLQDKEDEVRWTAGVDAALFKTFAPGAVEVLLRQVASANAEVRSTSLYFLARAGGKDKKVLDAIDKAKKDKVYDVRHSAHCAWFTATDNLEEFVSYIIRTFEDGDAVHQPRSRRMRKPGRKMQCGGTSIWRSPAASGCSSGATRAPDELATSPSETARRQSAPLMRRMGGKEPDPRRPSLKWILSKEPFNPLKAAPLPDLSPYIIPDKDAKPPKKEEPPQKSKVCVQYRKSRKSKRNYASCTTTIPTAAGATPLRPLWKNSLPSRRRSRKWKPPWLQRRAALPAAFTSG